LAERFMQTLCQKDEKQNKEHEISVERRLATLEK
jgi:hypothetical protein